MDLTSNEKNKLHPRRIKHAAWPIHTFIIKFKAEINNYKDISMFHHDNNIILD